MSAALDHREQGFPPVPLLPVLGPVVNVRRWQMDHMWSHVEPTMTCWVWHGLVDEDGYGKYSGRGAHVVVYERVIGKVPAPLQLDHLCFNRLCVNPGHLEPVTPRENSHRAMRRRFSDYEPGVRSSEGRVRNGVRKSRGDPNRVMAADRPACANGHPYTDESSYLSTRAAHRPGYRVCRVCDRLKKKRRRAQQVVVATPPAGQPGGAS